MPWPYISWDRRSQSRSAVVRPERAVFLWSLALALLLPGCAGNLLKDGPPRTGSVIPPGLPDDPVPRKEPRSPHGNGPVYRVNGNSYEVMESSYGYRERGVASWYGKKFHGRLTSSQEPYNMHGMTAAHKTLPLPTYVRVRNLRNNKSVIVRVNDRGPFVDNRIIDLSYSAARKLNMIGTGTSLVEVIAISFDRPPPAGVQATTETPESTIPATRESTIYVQVGAFGDAENARRRFALLRSGGIENAFVLEDSSRSLALYRIRIGPIDDVLQYDSLVARLQDLGISDTHLVTE
ncbi:MAG: septal ring lytic transglycosylase RlpA family protein, partial [Woeseia sp.]